VPRHQHVRVPQIGWPDGTNQTYFTELNNNIIPNDDGDLTTSDSVLTSLPTMIFSMFSGLSVPQITTFSTALFLNLTTQIIFVITAQEVHRVVQNLRVSRGAAMIKLFVKHKYLLSQHSGVFHSIWLFKSFDRIPQQSFFSPWF